MGAALWVALGLVALAGCNIENRPGGTAVGNPTGLTVGVAPADAVTFGAASVVLTAATFTDCNDLSATVEVGETIDLLGGVDLTAPAGTWCTLRLDFGSPISIDGVTDAGFDVALRLALHRLRFAADQGFEVDARPLVVELGEPGWFDPTAIGADTADVVITGGDVADELLHTIQTRSALYADEDEDGVLDEDERAAGTQAVATGNEEEDHDG